MISTQADVNRAPQDGYTPLSTACSRGHTDIALLLLDHGADVDVDGEGAAYHLPSKAQPLFFACREGHADAVRLCLQRGADANRRCFRGNTALHAACITGNAIIARLLVEYGADVNAVDDYGHTPLDGALGNNHTALAAWLVSEPRYVCRAELSFDESRRRRDCHVDISWRQVAGFGCDADIRLRLARASVTTTICA